MIEICIFKYFTEAEIFINFLNEFNILYEQRLTLNISEFIQMEVIIKYTERDINELKFINYLCKNCLKNIKHLENCYNKELSQCA